MVPTTHQCCVAVIPMNPGRHADLPGTERSRGLFAILTSKDTADFKRDPLIIIRSKPVMGGCSLICI